MPKRGDLFTSLRNQNARIAYFNLDALRLRLMSNVLAGNQGVDFWQIIFDPRAMGDMGRQELALHSDIQVLSC